MSGVSCMVQHVPSGTGSDRSAGREARQEAGWAKKPPPLEGVRSVTLSQLTQSDTRCRTSRGCDRGPVEARICTCPESTCRLKDEARILNCLLSVLCLFAALYSHICVTITSRCPVLVYPDYTDPAVLAAPIAWYEAWCGSSFAMSASKPPRDASDPFNRSSAQLA